jgi:hypothetical protein
MTVAANAATRNSFLTDGSSTDFALNVLMASPTHIRAQWTDPAGTVHALSYGADYTVTPSAPAGTNTLYGGTLVLAEAKAAGGKLYVWPETPTEQPLDLVQNDPFPPDAVEKELDRSRLIEAEARRELLRAMLTPRGEELNMGLPAIAARADRLLGFWDDGTPRASPFTIHEISDWLAGAVLTELPSNPATLRQLLKRMSGVYARDTLADLRAVPIDDDTPLLAQVQGHSAKGDGGEGLFYLDPDAPTFDRIQADRLGFGCVPGTYMIDLGGGAEATVTVDSSTQVSAASLSSATGTGHTANVAFGLPADKINGISMVIPGTLRRIETLFIALQGADATVDGIYPDLPIVEAKPGFAGSGGTATVVVAGGRVVSATVQLKGLNYGSGRVDLSSIAGLHGAAVAGFPTPVGGIGYNPGSYTVPFTGGGGTGASATAIASSAVKLGLIVNKGAGHTPGNYYDVPFVDGSGSGAYAKVVVGPDGFVISAQVSDGGILYGLNPALDLYGSTWTNITRPDLAGLLTGAGASVLGLNGAADSWTVPTRGVSYASAPTPDMSGMGAGGGGRFTVRVCQAPVLTAIFDDDGTAIVPAANPATGRWRRMVDGSKSAKLAWFGPHFGADKDALPASSTAKLRAAASLVDAWGGGTLDICGGGPNRPVLFADPMAPDDTVGLQWNVLRHRSNMKLTSSDRTRIKFDKTGGAAGGAPVAGDPGYNFIEQRGIVNAEMSGLFVDGVDHLVDGGGGLAATMRYAPGANSPVCDNIVFKDNWIFHMRTSGILAQRATTDRVPFVLNLVIDGNLIDGTATNHTLGLAGVRRFRITNNFLAHAGDTEEEEGSGLCLDVSGATFDGEASGNILWNGHNGGMKLEAYITNEGNAAIPGPIDQWKSARVAANDNVIYCDRVFAVPLTDCPHYFGVRLAAARMEFTHNVVVGWGTAAVQLLLGSTALTVPRTRRIAGNIIADVIFGNRSSPVNGVGVWVVGNISVGQAGSFQDLNGGTIFEGNVYENVISDGIVVQASGITLRGETFLDIGGAGACIRINNAAPPSYKPNQRYDNIKIENCRGYSAAEAFGIWAEQSGNLGSAGVQITACRFTVGANPYRLERLTDFVFTGNYGRVTSGNALPLYLSGCLGGPVVANRLTAFDTSAQAVIYIDLCDNLVVVGNSTKNGALGIRTGGTITKNTVVGNGIEGATADYSLDAKTVTDARITTTVSLTADNQVVTLGNASFLKFTSNNPTATSRTIVPTAPVQPGRVTLIWNDATNRGELVSGTAISGGAGTVRLASATTWAPTTQGSRLYLEYDGTDLVEVGRFAA